MKRKHKQTMTERQIVAAVNRKWDRKIAAMNKRKKFRGGVIIIHAAKVVR